MFSQPWVEGPRLPLERRAVIHLLARLLASVDSNTYKQPVLQLDPLLVQQFRVLVSLEVTAGTVIIAGYPKRWVWACVTLSSVAVEEPNTVLDFPDVPRMLDCALVSSRSPDLRVWLDFGTRHVSGS